MDREQKEYVRKQEEKRRKAQRMRGSTGESPDESDYFTFENPDRAFNNFFKVSSWRYVEIPTVPP